MEFTTQVKIATDSIYRKASKSIPEEETPFLKIKPTTCIQLKPRVKSVEIN